MSPSAAASLAAGARPSAVLPVAQMMAGHAAAVPVDNQAYCPGEGADVAGEFCGVLHIAQTRMHTAPELTQPIIAGRDARLFPGVTLAFFSLADILVPVRRGAMVRESHAGESPSFWCVIPQFGRVWREPEDADGWTRAAFALMLVNDTDNHAHQGLATFLYKDGAVSALHFQFVQQTAPYLLKQHFVSWGAAQVKLAAAGPVDLETRRAEAKAELAQRLAAKPWNVLLAEAAPGVLDSFGGPLHPKWRVAAALVRNGTLYYQDVQTPYGPYPYPLEMRFGARSVMKSIAAPLALLRLAQLYGPYVLTLKIGAYVAGLDPKYQRVRFIDAANMASGFGGTGTWNTNPNDIEDGYFGGDYDAWFLAPSHRQKVAQLTQSLRPYPWEPGTVVRYRDQDFYLLGVALDRFLKSIRGPQAEVWEMLSAEVFAPIGIAHAPAVKTSEAGGNEGYVCFNSGYYPTLDDLAKIAMLYQSHGAWGSEQILHRELTDKLLAAQDALVKSGDASLDRPQCSSALDYGGLYKMGFHFKSYVGSASQKRCCLPMMCGWGETEVVLYPHQLISIRMGKAAELPDGEKACSEDTLATLRAVDWLAPF